MSERPCSFKQCRLTYAHSGPCDTRPVVEPPAPLSEPQAPPAPDNQAPVIRKLGTLRLVTFPRDTTSTGFGAEWNKEEGYRHLFACTVWRRHFVIEVGRHKDAWYDFE